MHPDSRCCEGKENTGHLYGNVWRSRELNREWLRVDGRPKLAFALKGHMRGSPKPFMGFTRLWDERLTPICLGFRVCLPLDGGLPLADIAGGRVESHWEDFIFKYKNDGVIEMNANAC